MISDRWVVTAEHCINIAVGQVEVAQVGISTIRTGALTSSTGTEYDLDRIIAHPSADIGLLRTDVAVTFGPHVHPACLPPQDLCFNQGSTTVW